MAGVDTYFMAYPWLVDIGITVEQIQEWIIEGYEGETLVNVVRQTPQHRARFPFMRSADGTLRMNEAQYLARENDYRQVLSRNGIDVREYRAPATFAGFFEAELDPNELEQRLSFYGQLRRGSANTRDAFYVYAGMRVSVDDIYEAIVDPTKREALVNEYEVRVAKNPLDYQTWITRATEAGLERVTSDLIELRNQGVAVDDALARIRQLDPAFATQIMDVLLHGGDVSGNGRLLNLDELVHAFEYAMIGSAATESGLVLPEKERIEAIRQAGIERSEALRAYSEYSMERNLLAGAVQRARVSQQVFDQDQFERAVFLRQGEAAQLMEQGQRHEEALSKAGGGFGFTQDEAGRVRQEGLGPALRAR